MRGLTAIIPLLVLALHAIVGQSAVLVCLGGAHRPTGGNAAIAAGRCSHDVDRVGSTRSTGDADGVHDHGDHANFPGDVDHEHKTTPESSLPVPSPEHDEDCACTDLILGLRDDVSLRAHDDAARWAAAPISPLVWAIVGSPRSTSVWCLGVIRFCSAGPGRARCLDLVRSTRLVI